MVSFKDLRPLATGVEKLKVRITSVDSLPKLKKLLPRGHTPKFVGAGVEEVVLTESGAMKITNPMHVIGETSANAKSGLAHDVTTNSALSRIDPNSLHKPSTASLKGGLPAPHKFGAGETEKVLLSKDGPVKYTNPNTINANEGVNTKWNKFASDRLENKGRPRELE